MYVFSSLKHFCPNVTNLVELYLAAGDFDVWTITNEDSKPPNGGRVFIVVYGNKKKSDEVKLYSPDPNNKTFEPGNIDKFQVNV